MAGLAPTLPGARVDRAEADARVLKAMRSIGRESTPMEIALEARMATSTARTADRVRLALDRLRAAGKVVKVKNGLYRVVEPGG